MNNHTRKKDSRQSYTNRQKLIKAAQEEWIEQAQQLAENKAALGYKDYPWDEFLLIDPANVIDADMSIQTQIIALQNGYRTLKQREEIILAEPRVVADFNIRHAVVHLDQTYTLTEKINTLGYKDFSLESRQSFRAFYEDERVMCIDGVERCKADIWLQSPERRKYKGITFDPTTTECGNDCYNLWKGFAKQPKQGDAAKYWDHVRDNICGGNEELYIYVRKWLAYVFQHPDRVHTALVLCGSQGVGKNSFVEPLGVLLGTHYAPLSSITELVSNFNYHLKNAVLIHANEALWGGNKKELGTVKAMITEHTCLIEGKGKDRIVVRNFKHVILSSNEDWPVHLDPDDRRFVVITVSEKRKEDHTYFEAIHDQLHDGGYEALLYDLLHEDISTFNPRKMPANLDAFDIKMRSAESAHRYIFEALSEGGLSIGKLPETDAPVWQDSIPKDVIYADYVAWCEKSGEEALPKDQFCKIFKKLIPSTEDTRPAAEHRVRHFKLPSLRKSQEEFCKIFKEKPERLFENYEIA
ncbi:MAG: primase-helicase family protein [Candidatus Babeliales bacterium]